MGETDVPASQKITIEPRSVMNTEKKVFSLLAFVAVSFCLSSAEYTAPEIKKVYVLKSDVENKTAEYVRSAVAYADENTENGDIVLEAFAVTPAIWELIRNIYLTNYTIAFVDHDHFPIEGFYILVQMHPEMCSELLPHLLARASPETIAQNLPGPLTPSHKEHMVRECIDGLHLSPEVDHAQ